MSRAMNEKVEEKDGKGGRRIRWSGEWPPRTKDEGETMRFYGSVEDYDPVLRSHCGLEF